MSKGLLKYRVSRSSPTLDPPPPPPLIESELLAYSQPTVQARLWSNQEIVTDISLLMQNV